MVDGLEVLLAIIFHDGKRQLEADDEPHNVVGLIASKTARRECRALRLLAFLHVHL